jgi:hypothetical protein
MSPSVVFLLAVVIALALAVASVANGAQASEVVSLFAIVSGSSAFALSILFILIEIAEKTKKTVARSRESVLVSGNEAGGVDHGNI